MSGKPKACSLYSVVKTDNFFEIENTMFYINGRKTTLIFINEMTALIKNEKAKLMERFYHIMNATMSHEMKTPLNSIINTSK